MKNRAQLSWRLLQTSEETFTLENRPCHALARHGRSAVHHEVVIYPLCFKHIFILLHIPEDAENTFSWFYCRSKMTTTPLR